MRYRLLTFCLALMALFSQQLSAAVGVTLSPTTTTVNQGATQTFTATVTGSTNTAVTWTVTGTGNGTITTAGVYTAPAKAGAFTVRATSKADTLVYAEGTVTVPNVSVSISPTAATVPQGGTQQFTATVTGAKTTTVTWTTTGGTISTSGKFTAPAAAGTYTIKATSTADVSKFASATVTVPSVAVSINPATATVLQGGTQQFTAGVTGASNTAVTWSVLPATGSGTVSTSGLYTAPIAAGTFKVRATSGADATKYAEATVTVPAIAISVSPTTATVAQGASQVFTATVTGAKDATVTWTASGGTITTAGSWKAPATAGTYTITATSKANTTKTAKASATVPIKITISPTSATVNQGTTRQFTATVTGTPTTTVKWTTSKGTITTGGLYTAPAVAGSYTVTATSTATPAVSVSAPVVVPDVTISLNLTAATVLQGGNQQFTATVVGASNTGVTWSVSPTAGGGTVNATGRYTAPAAAGTYTVRATSQANTAKFAEATITVPNVSITMSPTSVTLDPLTSQQFSATVSGAANLGKYWYVSNGLGSISSSGLYTAPREPGTYTITVGSDADTSKTATATIIVRPIVIVTLNPTNVSLSVNSSQAFIPLVTGTNNPVVTWSVVGGATNGWVSPSGIYYAPAKPGIYSIVATSVADPSKSATALVTVQNLTGPQISIDPEEVTLQIRDTYEFHASTTSASGNGNSLFTYSCSGGAIQDTENGNFIYTAPETPGDYFVMARPSGGNAQGSALVHVQNPSSEISISVNPKCSLLWPGGCIYLGATVSRTSNDAVTWTVVGGDASGSFVPQGTYWGWYTAPALTGNYTVIATSVADPSKSEQILIQVIPRVQVSGGYFGVFQGESEQFQASLTGASDQSVNWSATEGTVSSGGLFTAPSFPCEVMVTATSNADPRAKGILWISVPAVSVKLSASGAVTTLAGSEYPLTAEVRGTRNTAVLWSVISGGGRILLDPIYPDRAKFLAPYATGETIVQVASIADPTKTAVVTFTMLPNSSVVLRSLEASPFLIQEGGTASLIGDFWNGTGVVQPGNLAMIPGVPVNVSPQGSMNYTLKVVGSDANYPRSISTALGVVGPGHGIVLPNPKSFYGISQTKLLMDRAGRPLLVGGHEYSSSSFTIERFDPPSNTWTTVNRMQYSGIKDYQSVMLPNGLILIIPGWIDGGMTAYIGEGMYLLDPDSGTSTAVNRNTGLRLCAAVPLDDGGILIAGGEGFPGNLTWWVGQQGELPPGLEPKSCASVFYPNTSTFQALPNMNRIQGSCQGLSLLDGRVILAGNNALEVFDPALKTFTLIGTYSANVNLEGVRPDGKVIVRLPLQGGNQCGIFDPISGVLEWDPRLFTTMGGGSLLPDGRLLSGPSSSVHSVFDPIRLLHFALRDFVPNPNSWWDPESLTAILPSGLGFVFNDGHASLVDSEPTLVITPASGSYNIGFPVQFEASGAAGSSGVTWSASSGMIGANGLFQASKEGCYVISATGISGKKAYAILRILPKITVNVRQGGPYPAMGANDPYPSYSTTIDSWFSAGSSRRFYARVNNHPDPRVTWGITEGAVGGSITTDGVYTAPVANSGPFHIVATSVADPTANFVFTVYVSDPLTVEPATARTRPLGKVRLRALAAGGSGPVEWTVTGGSAVVAVDPINQPDLFEWTAPATPGNYVLTVSWLNHSDCSKTVTITVVPAAEAAIFVFPSMASVRPNATISWWVGGTTSVDPQDNGVGIGGLRGTLIGPIGTPTPLVMDLGLLGRAGILTAPTLPGNYRFLLTQQQAPGLTAEGVVQVLDIPAILDFKIDPPLVLDGKSYTLTWSGVNADAAFVDGKAQSFPSGSLTFDGSLGGTHLFGESFQTTHVLKLTKASAMTGKVTSDERTLSAIRGKLTLAAPPSAQEVTPGGTIQVPTTVNLLAGVDVPIPMLSSKYKLSLDVDWTVSAGQILETSGSMPVTKNPGTTACSYTVSPWVKWRAPLQPGDYTLTATSRADAAILCAIPVKVLASAVGVLISPFTAQVYAGGSIQFTYGIYAPTTRVVWTSSFGSITQAGLFTAPSTTSTGTVTVTSVDDPTKSSTAQVSVASVVNIAITPKTISLFTGQSQQFGFSLVAPSNRVVWTSGAGGGSITQGGLYTAPATPGTYQVSIYSVDDPSKGDTSTVTVNPPGVTLGILPASAEVNPGQAMTFGTSIHVTGSTDQGIIWSCEGGTLVAKGAYAFYAAPLVPGTYTVTATSVANPAVSASATIGVGASTSTTTRLGLFPQNASLNPGQRVFLGSDFVVPDPQTGLDWTASAGQLAADPTSASAFFTAPVGAGSCTVTVKGRTHGDLSNTVSLNVTTATAPAFAVMPSAATLGTGQAMLLEAMDGQGRIIPNPIWSIQEAQGGLITGAGMYVAPLSAGTYHVLATHPDDPAQLAIATLTVLSGGGSGSGGSPEPTDAGVMVVPDKAQIPAGTYQSFSALVRGMDDQRVMWTVENAPGNASVDAQGVFVASQRGTYRVFATSTADPTRNGSAVITVVPSVTPIAGAPSGQTRKGYSVTALKNGRVLIFGGSEGNVISGSGQVYDPATGLLTNVSNALYGMSYHTAALLDDGRVLISGGFSAAQNPTPGASGPDFQWRAGAVYDPVSNSFQELPVPTTTYPMPAHGLMRGSHVFGTAVRLVNGQILIVGSDYPESVDMGWLKTAYQQFRRSDVFDPSTNTFDVSNWTTDPMKDFWSPTLNCFESLPGQTVVALKDGRALITGGHVPPVADSTDPCTGQARTPFNPPPAARWDYTACLKNDAKLYTPGAGTSAQNPMTSPRSYHTMTKLADGRVLITGGYQSLSFTARPAEVDPVSGVREPNAQFTATASAEIFDPTTGTFTPTGNMNDARALHAAILLPTGQVLIVGGTKPAGLGAFTYPTTMELYDPGTGKFSVMDHLDYGLEEPKLALLPNGDTFIMGVVQGYIGASLKASSSEGFAFTQNPSTSIANNATVTLQGATGNRIRILPTITQAVERYLDDQDQAEFAKTPYQWRTGVPIVGGRGARVRIQAYGSTDSVKDVEVELWLNGKAIPLSQKTIKIQKGIPVLDKVIYEDSTSLVTEASLFPSDLNADFGDTNDPRRRKAEFEVILKKDGKVIAQTDPVHPIAPMVRQSRPYKVYVQAMSYQRPKDASGNFPPVDTIPVARVTEIVNELKLDLPRLYPLTEGAVEVKELGLADGFKWDESIRGNLLDVTQWTLLNDKVWPPFLQNKLQVWDPSDPNRPENSHRNFYLLLLPIVEGGTTKAGKMVGGICQIGEHFPCVLAEAEPGWGVEQYVANTVLHELGHGHDSKHAKPERTSGIPGATSKGCALNPKVAAGSDDAWPTTGHYGNGRIGVPGFDLKNRVSLDYYAFTDIMTYCDQKWVSDYTLQKWWKHNEARPAIPIDLAGPEVIFISPADYEKVSGKFQIVLNIQDDGSLSTVTYQVDGQPAKTITAPYSFEVDPVAVLSGSNRVIQVAVTATDSAGRSSTNYRAFEFVPPPTP